MMKINTLGLCSLVLFVSGCSTTPNEGTAERSMLESIPFVYRPDIQQGNIVKQEQFNQLKKGMTQRQVKFLLGTPLIVDAFHQNRWDYLYSLKKNNEQRSQEVLTLEFEDGKLSHFKTDLKFDSESPAENANQEVVVSVPDYKPKKKGLIDQALGAIGVQTDD